MKTPKSLRHLGLIGLLTAGTLSQSGCEVLTPVAIAYGAHEIADGQRDAARIRQGSTTKEEPSLDTYKKGYSAYEKTSLFSMKNNILFCANHFPKNSLLTLKVTGENGKIYLLAEDKSEDGISTWGILPTQLEANKELSKYTAEISCNGNPMPEKTIEFYLKKD